MNNNDLKTSFNNIAVGKRAAIYTPYDLMPGGGEKYLLTIAEYFLKEGCKVSLLFDEIYSKLRLKQMENELGVRLDGATAYAYSEAVKKIKAGEEKFDIFVSMGNSLTPWINPLGNHNVYICQFPFPQDEDWIIENSATLKKYDEIIVYSDFVMERYKNLLKKYGLPDTRVSVVYPPCRSQSGLVFEELKKLPDTKPADKIIILTVGRFFSEGHCKRQDFLIESFIEMLPSISYLNVELHVAGGIHPTKDGRDFFTKCKNMAQDFNNIFLYGNIDAHSLKELYFNAHIYWHAAGINVDSSAHPEMLEHFGITVVEAMSAGAIPIVVNKGGPAEIVRNGIEGFCFNSKEELIGLTVDAVKKITADRNIGKKSKLESLVENSLLRATDFTKEKFYSRLESIFPNKKI